MPLATIPAPDGARLPVPYVGPDPDPQMLSAALDHYMSTNYPDTNSLGTHYLSGLDIAQNPLAAAAFNAPASLPALPLPAFTPAPPQRMVLPQEQNTAPFLSRPSSSSGFAPPRPAAPIPPTFLAPTGSAPSAVSTQVPVPKPAPWNGVGVPPMGVPAPSYHAPRGPAPDLTALIIKTDTMPTIQGALQNLAMQGDRYERLIQLGKTTPADTAVYLGSVKKNIDALRPTGYLETDAGRIMLSNYIKGGAYKPAPTTSDNFVQGAKDFYNQNLQNLKDVSLLQNGTPDDFGAHVPRLPDDPQTAALKRAAMGRMEAQTDPVHIAHGFLSDPVVQPTLTWDKAVLSILGGYGLPDMQGVRQAGRQFADNVHNQPFQMTMDVAPFLLDGAGALMGRAGASTARLGGAAGKAAGVGAVDLRDYDLQSALRATTPSPGPPTAASDAATHKLASSLMSDPAVQAKMGMHSPAEIQDPLNASIQPPGSGPGKVSASNPSHASVYHPARNVSPSCVVIGDNTVWRIHKYLQPQANPPDTYGFVLRKSHIDRLEAAGTRIVPAETIQHLRQGLADNQGHGVIVVTDHPDHTVATLRETLLHEPQHILQYKHPLSQPARDTLVQRFSAIPELKEGWDRFSQEMTRLGYQDKQNVYELPAWIASGGYRRLLKDGKPLLSEDHAERLYTLYAQAVRKQHGSAAAAEFYNASPLLRRAWRQKRRVPSDYKLTGVARNGKPIFRPPSRELISLLPFLKSTFRRPSR